MKVVMIRSNTYVPDVRLEKKVTSLSRNGYDVLLTGWDRLETPLVKNRKPVIRYEEFDLKRIQVFL
jgi:hypothetical protein